MILRSSTITTTPGAATLDGCWGLSVSDAAWLADIVYVSVTLAALAIAAICFPRTAADTPEFQEALRQVLARAAGPDVLPEYAAGVATRSGECMVASILAVEQRSLI